MKAVLEGIRVVDCTVWQVGPSASEMLAELGAEVIHIEQPITGDPMRGLESRGGPSLIVHGYHVLFEDFNRKKKSVVIDLKTDKGKRVMYDLVAKSDVFLTNYRSKAMQHLGMDYKSLAKCNSRLIYASASAFGRRGPDSEIPAMNLTGLARGGAMLTAGDKGMPPIESSPAVADRITAIFLSYGIITALLGRERLGIGQEIHVSMLGGVMTLISSTITGSLWCKAQYERPERAKKWNPLYNYYKCKDGKWIALALLQSDRYWPDFCKALDTPHLQEDPRFMNSTQRAENRESLTALLDEIFATQNYDVWEKRFRQAGDLLYSPVNTVSDLTTDPQVIANGLLVEWEHPGLGLVKSLGFPVEFTRTPATAPGPAPQFGQHTEEVLTEVCGYRWEDIAKLKEEGII